MVECIFKATGKVIHGFGRANLDDTVLETLPKSMVPGVYAGFAQVNDGPVYPMVMSLGWNPFYKNEKKSLEVHILNTFEKDFYDERLSIVVLSYLRPERDFESVEKLIEEIQNDIATTAKLLQKPQYTIFTLDPIFKL
nr:riboflavin kinase [Hymenolepis microstoma]